MQELRPETGKRREIDSTPTPHYVKLCYVNPTNIVLLLSDNEQSASSIKLVIVNL